MRHGGLGFPLAIVLTLACAPGAMAYTAVAISDSRAYGYCNNMQSLGEAADCAMRYCRQSATDPQTCVVGFQSEPTGNYALAIGDGGWGAAMGQSQAEADRDALGYCKAAGCVVVARWTEGIVRGE
ncbi:DUF4189 domain-containing protein [Devosia sp. CN2-171]|jgi:hypothetical protein|uniref:DUF4189 domain-containing protein n=1 Tax=Devosia sp. CN2-171 TaxID=3400909 RepID=UPI003BF8A0EF